ncbi:ATP-binding protein [Cohnella silvisoli]|uniref:ATP-binding protein n=1 Tax=Cohnella silvisoli TaxID=2873699 RepID=A0ABV1KPF5_9BACL|nr:ATP-binding protein [Cohnella silvisoli]MCD9022377.1 ATP-binding protein [Cohnella silvisoli]
MYNNDREYLKDQWEWLDSCIALRLHLQERFEQHALTVSGSTGELLSEFELFESIRTLASVQENDAVTVRLLKHVELIERRIEDRLKLSEEANVFLALPYLSRIFGLSAYEVKGIIVCLAVEVDRKYESSYELMQRDKAAKLPTPDLISQLVSRSEEDLLLIRAAFDEEGPLKKYFLRQEVSTNRMGTLLNRQTKLDERIVRFLLHSGDVPPSMDPYVTFIHAENKHSPLIGNMDIQNKLRQWITNRILESEKPSHPLIISLWGKPGSGKKTQAFHLCQYFNQSVLCVDLDKWPASNKDDIRERMNNLFREATIQQAVLVFCHFEAWVDKAERVLSPEATYLLHELWEMSGIVFLLSEEPCQPLDQHRLIDLEVELPALSDADRSQAWSQLTASYAVDSTIDWEALSARFLFNVGQMKDALKAAKTLSEWNRGEAEAAVIGWRDMIQASYKQLNHSLGNKSKRLSPKNSWGDLILPAVQKEKLQHACNHIQYKHTVYGRWGFDKKLSYGTGISLLFSGPPGTGKTMASEIVAKELDMEIYKIDLSQIISKYIGETEKNLREIFDEAQASYAVLFFDEADALFGKRSEVKDSHDKNANTEVAFLLQKMEEYRGISILATNYLQNMDEAFLRRINYVIRFPFPDEKQRETIWQHIFPVQTPLEKDIDFNFLARKLQMAGGSIKNIALTAAFLASGKDEKVGMRHIFKAYQYELDKTNRALTRDDLGEYAYLYDELTSV